MRFFLFLSQPDYKDSMAQADFCKARIKDVVYEKGAELKKQDTEESLTQAIEVFLSQPDYRDSMAQADSCKARREEIKRTAEAAALAEHKKQRKCAVQGGVQQALVSDARQAAGFMDQVSVELQKLLFG